MALDLLLGRDEEVVDLFHELKNRGVNLWIPVFSLLELQTRIRDGKNNAFGEIFTESVKPLSSPGHHWLALPEKCTDKRCALTILASLELPGETVVWTNRSIDMPGLNGGKVLGEANLKKWLTDAGSDLPFIDLGAQQAAMRNEIEKRIFSVLSHGKFILGPEIQELESVLRDFVGTRHAVACSSGTDALLMPLMAWNVKAGDAVFTTPFTFIATAEVIALTGAVPVFVDIEPETFNIDPLKLSEAIEKVKSEGILEPKVIIPVDLFGQPADYDTIDDIAKHWNLLVLEDGAQSFGASYHGRRAGNLGDAAATSFFPAKPLGCYGDGGAVFTNDDDLARKLTSIRVHGKGDHKYDNVRIGLNARMDTLQAAILLAKLNYFPEELEKRNRAAHTYSTLLKDHVKVPRVPEGVTSAWAQYSILLGNEEERNGVIEALKKRAIPTAVYYPKPLHLQRAFSYLGYKEGDFPVAEDISKRILSLPMHPYLENTVEYIAEQVIEALKYVR